MTYSPFIIYPVEGFSVVVCVHVQNPVGKTHIIAKNAQLGFCKAIVSMLV
jgi:hypothetical protein